MWFATPTGLSSLSKGRWATYGIGNGMPSENINCLLQDSSGVVWAGTASGLAFLSQGSFHVPPRAPALLSGQVLGFAEDRYGWLWIATSTHVLRIRRDRLMNGVLVDGDVLEYGLSEGLRGTGGVKRHQSVFQDHSGRIWFSLNRGISVVDPARLSKNSALTMVHIQTLTADGNSIDVAKDIRIPGGRQRVTFGFAGLILAAPGRVRYRYILDGYDRNWSAPVADSEISYTNLPPRAYRFRVIASNPEGVWNRSEGTIEFKVDPLFWQTWWFVSVALIAFILLALAGYSLRLNYLTERLRLQFEDRLAERIQVARDLHDTLLQTIQGSKLVADNVLSTEADQARMRGALEKLSVWLGQAIQEGRLALSSLRSSTTQQNDLLDAFRRACEECRMERAIEFDFMIEGESRQMHPIVRDEVYRIGYEAIRNACLHSEASRLAVELSYTKDLILRVRDNGKGISRDVVAKGMPGHFGLIGMRERAERLRGKLTFSSPGGTGTLVELVVPQKVSFPQSRRVG